jgi:sigma-E factor negative regulatory protein RseA
MEMEMNEQLNKCEAVSALADGQLRGEAFARAVEAVSDDAQARAAWCNYHLVGDALRFGAGVGRSSDDAFVDRFRARLAQENALGVPAIDSIAAGARGSFAAAGKPAANDGSFRWKAVAGFASFAAVAAIGWNMIGATTAPAQPQMAAAPAAAPGQPAAGLAIATNDPRGAMIRDPRLDELMAAHRQFGGTSALQMPAGFLRNATFEGPSR